jgi:hypothetical protein
VHKEAFAVRAQVVELIVNCKVRVQIVFRLQSSEEVKALLTRTECVYLFVEPSFLIYNCMQ